jgi:DNA-binding beta-propeller fold protein YncE
MNTTLIHRFAKGLHLFFIATLLAALAIMVAPSPMGPAEADGQGPWVIVALNSGGTDPETHQTLPGALYTVYAPTNSLHGPFLQGKLGSGGGGLFDVAITPDCSTALVSNFGDSTVYLVDFSDPTHLKLLGSVNPGFFAEDIDITADGRFAVVANGGSSARLASIDIATRTLVEVEDLGTNYANAVDVAPDGTVIVADYSSMKVHTLTIDSSGNLAPAHSYDIPTVTKDGTLIGPRPVNVAVAPDGQTVLVLTCQNDFVTVYRITGPGNLDYVGRVFGLPAVWDDEQQSFHGSQQSVAFNCDGTRAYVLTNGRGYEDPENPEETERPSQISVLGIRGPGLVSLITASAADITHLGSSQLFGVDVLAVAGGRFDKLYVSNPTVSGASTDLRVVDLRNYSVSSIPVGPFEDAVPVGVAVCPLCVAIPIGGIAVPVNKAELLAPWVGLAALASLTTLTIALVRRRRSA